MKKQRLDADGKVVFTEVSTEQQSSIEINQTAKGDLTFKAKVYADNPLEMENQLAHYLEIAKRAKEGALGLDIIKVFPDGDQICALQGVNLQEGRAGFGKTVAEALRELANDLEKAGEPTKEGENGK